MLGLRSQLQGQALSRPSAQCAAVHKHPLLARHRAPSVQQGLPSCSRKFAISEPAFSQQATLQQQRRSVQTAAAASDAPAPAPSSTGTSTFTQATINVVSIMMGMGLLSLPFALKSSGWVGIGLLWLMGIVTNYTGKALVECANAVSKKKGYGPSTVVGYEEIAEEAFGKLGRLLVSSIIYVELIGTCCLLFILEGDNMFSLFGTKFAQSASQYMLLAAALMIPTVWLPDLSALSFLGVFGVGATTAVVCSVAYTLFTGSFVPGAPTDPALWATLPLVFGIMTFCYSGHGVFPAIQASMKKPEEFPSVLNAAFFIVAFLSSFIGAAGYFMYGTAAADVVIFNLPPMLATLCSCLVLINPVAKFALTMEPVAAAATSAAGGANGPLTGAPRLLLRTGLAIGILFAARSLPFLAYVMALVGSFMTISVSVTFPALCHLILCKGQIGAGKVAWNYFVAALGTLCTVAGTAASMKSLAAKAAGGV